MFSFFFFFNLFSFFCELLDDSSKFCSGAGVPLLFHSVSHDLLVLSVEFKGSNFFSPGPYLNVSF